MMCCMPNCNNSNNIALQLPVAILTRDGKRIDHMEAIGMCRACVDRVAEAMDSNSVVQSRSDPDVALAKIIIEAVFFLAGLALLIFVKAAGWKVLGGLVSLISLILFFTTIARFGNSVSANVTTGKTASKDEIMNALFYVCKRMAHEQFGSNAYIIKPDYFDASYTAERLSKELGASLDAGYAIRLALNQSK